MQVVLIGAGADDVCLLISCCLLQSVVTYNAVGPTLNGKSVLANCEANTKGSLFSSSTAAKEIKKATDTCESHLLSHTCGDLIYVARSCSKVPSALQQEQDVSAKALRYLCVQPGLVHP